MKALNGRLAELSLIASHGAEIVYSDTGWIAPNRWISRDIILDFESRGLIERKGNHAVVTPKGNKLLAEKKEAKA